MLWADWSSWFVAGRELPADVWRSVRDTAGCTTIRELACPDDWPGRMSLELETVPRTLLASAGVDHLFVARELQSDGRIHDGIADERSDGTRWVGINAWLFADQTREQYPKLPRLRAVLIEEIVDVWDFSLETRASRYYSVDRAGRPEPRWRAAECDRHGRLFPFPIPNRKVAGSPANQIAEDWASAVVWYLFRRDFLESLSPARHDFVEELFRVELGRP